MSETETATVSPKVTGAGAIDPEKRRTVVEHSYLLDETGDESFPERYLNAILLGMTKKDAAAYCSASVSAVRAWEQQAEIDWEAGVETQFTEFTLRVRRARAEVAGRNLLTIEAARRGGDWKAAAWMLERNGYNQTTELDAGENTRIVVHIDSLDSEA